MATAASDAPARVRPQRAVRVRGRSYPVVLPSVRDPRLHVALVIGTLQVLGQTVLGFELSVAQILVCLAVCAVIEVGVGMWRERMLLWPASAMLTGNSVAFIMRSAGTRHGDWWSLTGVDVFVVACVLSMASKYLLRRGGRHVFNPSNLGLVAAFTLYGTQRANPQDLWWGPLSAGIWVTLAVIVVGGLVIARRLRMLQLCAAFWGALAAGTAIVAAGGHCIAARWSVAPVCGEQYWSVMATSPEVLVFLFFMITDPRTAPAGGAAPAGEARGRTLFGATVGFLAALLSAPMQTEFATKVALLGSLVLVCGALPLAPLLRRIPRRRPAALAALPAAAGALLLAALPAHGSAAPIPATPAAATEALPPITISPEAQRTAGVTSATARALVAAALRRAPGPVLRAVVVVQRNPLRPQDPPRLAVELQGAGWTRTVAP